MAREGNTLEDKFILSRINIILENYGIKYFSYGIKERDKKLVSYFNHPGWGEKYINSGYFLADPLVEAARYLNNSLVIWDMVPIYNKQQRLIMEERFSKCKLTSGVTFSRKKDDIFEIIALGYSRTHTKLHTNSHKIFHELMQPLKEFHYL